MGFWQAIATNLIQRNAGAQQPNIQQFLEGIQTSKKSKQNGLFSSLLNGQKLTVPTPPTPPADLTDLEAQRQYNQALLVYNQQFRQYHTNMMGVMMQRFQQMQQMMLRTQFAQQQAQRTSNAVGSTATSNDINTVGGIIDTGDI